MSRISTHLMWTTLLPVSLALLLASHAVAAPPATCPIRPTLAVSLTVLQEDARAAARAGRLLPKHVATMAGLKDLKGYVLLQGEEVVLVGHQEPRQPSFLIDDLAVALRHAYGVAGIDQEGPIGVTIDPLEDREDPWAIQRVKTFGVARPTGAQAPGMTWRMWAIDYALKRVSAGLEPAGNVPSLWDLARQASAPRCDRGGRPEQTHQMRHRFWFTDLVPARPRFMDDPPGALILRSMNVQLLTEQQLLDARGRRHGTAPPSPLAEQFARLVTEQLLATDAVAEYARLRQDFRVIELAKLLRFKQVSAESLQYLLSEHVVQQVAVPSYVAGVRREESQAFSCGATATVREANGRIQVSVQAPVHRSVHSSRGGVEARVPIDRADSASDNTGCLALLRARVEASRPAGRGLAWTITDRS